MQNARWFLFAAVAVPTIAACGGDDSSDAMVDAGGAGGSGGISTDSGAGGGAGAAGGGGKAGASKDATNGSDLGGARDSAGGSSGSAGAGGASGASVDAASDTTTVRDTGSDGTGGARPDSGSGNDAPTFDGGAACSSGPAMGMTCTHYCSAWFSTCQPMATWSTTYASPTACMSACAQWNDTKLCCRAEHVHDATVAPNPNQADKQCGQAVGVNAPDACL